MSHCPVQELFSNQDLLNFCKVNVLW